MNAIRSNLVYVQLPTGYTSFREKPDDIIRAVELLTGIPVHVMKTKTRKREVVHARYLAMVALRERTSLTLRSIADLLGGFDHTTVITAKKTISDLVEIDHPIKPIARKLVPWWVEEIEAEVAKKKSRRLKIAA